MSEKRCDKCNLSNSCKNPLIFGKGSGKNKTEVMIIQDAPTFFDDRCAQTPAGDTKAKINYFLEQAGIDYRTVYFTSALKCAPKELSDIKNKNIEACRDYLLTEIVERKPKLIIVMGKYAHQSLTDKTSVDDFAGHFDDFEFMYEAEIGMGKTTDIKFKCKLMPTYSLMGSMRKWENDSEIIRHFSKGARFLKDGFINKTPEPKVNLILDKRSLNQFVEKMREEKYATTDLETTGFEFFKDEIINAGYCTKVGEADVIYYSTYKKEHIKKWDRENIELGKRINYFVKENHDLIHKSLQTVNDFDNLNFILHNGKFDWKFAKKNGIPYKNFKWCTLVADSLIDENMRHSLNHAMERRGIDYGPYDTKLWPYVNKDGDKKKSYKHVPPLMLTNYLGIDVDGDMRLFQKQVKEIEKIDLTDHMVGRKMDALLDLCQMEYTGVKADRALIQKTSRIIQKKQTKILSKLEEVTGIENFNPNSPKQINDYFLNNDYPLEKLKIAKNKSGYSTAAVELKKFTKYKKFQEVPNLILDAKKLAKIKGTYVDGNSKKGETASVGGFLKYLDERDRVHANFNMWTARTSRYSCLSLDTEILTTDGWIKYNEMTKEHKVLAYDKDERVLKPQNPTWIYLSEKEKRKMVRIKTTHVDQVVTADHNCLIESNYKVPYVFKAEDFKSIGQQGNRRFIHGANYSVTKNKFKDINMLRFIVAVQADGSINMSKNRIFFTFRKPRKIERIKKLCSDLNLEIFSEESYPAADSKLYSEEIVLSVERPAFVFEYIDSNKCYMKSLLSISDSEREDFLNELKFWDGEHAKNCIALSTIEKQNIDIIQAIIAMHGRRSLSRSKDPQRENWQIIHSLHETKRNFTQSRNATYKEKEVDCRVWCIEVPTHFFVARRNGTVFVTGNCNRPSLQIWPRPIAGLPNARNFIIPSKGMNLFEADFKALEQFIVAALSKDMTLIKTLKSGRDIHCQNAVELGHILGIVDKEVDYQYFLDHCGKGNLDPKTIPPDVYMKFSDLRTRAKSIGFGLNYGKGAESFADEFKISAFDAQEMIDAYFEIYWEMKAWRDRLIREGFKNGFISLESGRRRRFGSAINWLDHELSADVWSSERLRSEIERQIMNYPVQGGAHEAFETGCIRVNKAFRKEKLKARIMLSIHDGIVGECPPQENEHVLHILKTEMTSVLNAGTKYELKLDIDCDIYTREWYGEKNKLIA